MHLLHNYFNAFKAFSMLRDLAYDIFRDENKIVESYKLMGAAL